VADGDYEYGYLGGYNDGWRKEDSNNKVHIMQISNDNMRVN
jgi:hypothetical protein